MKEVHVVWETHIGDDWESTETHIVYSLKEVDKYESEDYKKEVLKIGGVYGVDITVEKFVTPEKLQSYLTVKEYLKVFPELKKLMSKHWDYIHE